MAKRGRGSLGKMGKHTLRRPAFLGPLALASQRGAHFPASQEPTLQSVEWSHPVERRSSQHAFVQHSGLWCMMDVCWGEGWGASLFMPINAIFNFC